jgi:Glycosyl transferase family 11
MKRMIVVQLMGGLGNQIFQYAAALAIQDAMKKQGPICFVSADNKHSRQTYFHLFNGGSLLREPFPIGDRYCQNDAFEAWNPSTFKDTETLLLYGYFQFIPAIASVIPRLQREFGLFQESRAAFVHVRRGDYLQNPTLHWLQSPEYYEEGMKLVGADKWVVFSDDLDWCREQSCFQRPDLQFIDEKDEVTALRLMASCTQGAVISNSTFSYWAAILGDIECVVYPKKWYGDSTPVLFPEGWMEL